MSILKFFSVENIAFTIIGYPMSWIELLGTGFNLWSVWLAAKNRVLTWPIGLIGVVLFLSLFYQIQLYSDTFEQIYYLILSFYGWWLWIRVSKEEAVSQAARVQFGSMRGIIVGIAVTIVGAAILGTVISQIHLWLPTLFSEPASFPYLDALTTMMSFIATWLMAQRRIECWFYWIAVDIIGIGLYFVKDVRLIALLYLIFLIMASNGLRIWLDLRRSASANIALTQQQNPS